jgi:hypothetical protein
LLRWLNAPTGWLPDDPPLYAAAYRPVLRNEAPQIDVWAKPCAVGAALPTMPLRLTGDLFVPVEFEVTRWSRSRRATREQTLCSACSPWAAGATISDTWRGLGQTPKRAEQHQWWAASIRTRAP